MVQQAPLSWLVLGSLIGRQAEIIYRRFAFAPRLKNTHMSYRLNS